MTDPVEILDLTSDQLAHAAEERFGRGRGFAATVHRNAVLDGQFAPEATGAGPRIAEAWRRHFRLTLPRLVREHREPTELGTTTAKAVFATCDGYEFESVRIPLGTDRASICLSTQVGCRMGCRFCETAKMGFHRNLTAAEIVGQVVAARAQLGWSPTSLVFMGMGEPLDNFENLEQALHVLTDRRGLAFARERITVCTVGRCEGIDRLAALGWKRLELALSLNAGNDEKRAELMPIARQEPLVDLQAALIRYRRRKNLELAIHYCLMPDHNGTREDARQVAAFVAPLGRTMVHLIPYNPGTAPISRAPTAAECDQFIGWLRDEGLAVRRRITKGRSVMAACGQLGNIELRSTRRAALH